MASVSINDPIHGTIKLSETETKIIDHAFFQRLRRIKALGLLDRVFPSARHSRFEHSIGACHVAGLLFKSIERNTRELCLSSWHGQSEFKGLTPSEIDTIFSVKYYDSVRIAALLHDLGHGPFSHASESIMPARSVLLEVNNHASPEVLAAIRKRTEKKDKADHEDYSVLLADQLLKTYLDDDARRLAIHLKDSKIEYKTQDGNWTSILAQLVSGEFDSDRMDYLRRDSLFCGVPYGNFDFNRLLEGLVVVKNRDNKYSFAIRRSSISALEGFIFSRFQMHVQIYSHRIDGALNKAFESYAERRGYELPAAIGEYACLDDESIATKIKSPELQNMLADRKLWKVQYESYSDDNSNDVDFIASIEAHVGKGNCKVHTNEKPIKKPEMLKFPVIVKTTCGRLHSQELRSTSQLIDRYNASFKVTRLFVDYALRDKAAVWKDRLLGLAQNEQEQLAKKEVQLNQMLAQPTGDSTGSNPEG